MSYSRRSYEERKKYCSEQRKLSLLSGFFFAGTAILAKSPAVGITSAALMVGGFAGSTKEAYDKCMNKFSKPSNTAAANDFANKRVP